MLPFRCNERYDSLAIRSDEGIVFPLRCDLSVAMRDTLAQRSDEGMICLLPRRVIISQIFP